MYPNLFCATVLFGDVKVQHMVHGTLYPQQCKFSIIFSRFFHTAPEDPPILSSTNLARADRSKHGFSGMVLICIHSRMAILDELTENMNKAVKQNCKKLKCVNKYRNL